MGGFARLQGRADSRLGRSPHRSRQGGVFSDLLRRAHGNRGEPRARHHRARHASAGPARRGQPGLRRSLRRLRAAGGARQPGGAAEMGGRTDAERRQGVEAAGPEGARHLLRLARLAVRLSVAAARAGADRDGVRRAGASLAADPRRLRRSRLRRRLRNPSRRRPVRRRDLRALPRRGRRPQALQHSLRPVALRAAAARLSRLSSTSITSG